VAAFNFKSSGFTYEDINVVDPESQPKRKPIGIKTPLEFSRKSSQQLFHMNDNPIFQVKDNLRNLILTEKGERIGRPDYGCGLKNYVFDMTAIPNYEQVIINIIKGQVEKFMPFVLITNIEILDYYNNGVDQFDQRSSRLSATLLRVSFEVQKIAVKNQKVDVVIFSGG
jgi:phage baseplate assembly protein W